MDRERRRNKQLTQEDVRKLLNPRQFTALLEAQCFGWRLKFIRSPLFREPVPVLYNPRIEKIGVLDPDGQVNMDVELEVRAVKASYDQPAEAQQPDQAPEGATWKEKRKDIVPVPGNLAEVLSPLQIRSLRQIETFGWRLHFVRRPLFQEPVPVILSPEGDKYATLENDGRINLTPDSALRKEEAVEQAVSATSGSGEEIKQA